MKRITLILAAALAIAGCGNRGSKNASEENMIENGQIGYADVVSFLVQGFQCGWEGMSPEDQGLSYVYSYNSDFAGHAMKDINGDGIPELLLGDCFEDGTTIIYDIYTINPDDGLLIHLAKGGERDTFSVNGSGIIVESGSNSAFDSFTKGYAIKDGKLEEVQAWEDDAMKLEFERFKARQ